MTTAFVPQQHDEAAAAPDTVDAEAHRLIELPSLRSLGGSALPHIIEGALAPAAVFYTVMLLTDVWGALLAALAWSYAALIRRRLMGKRIGGLLLITALTLTVRTAIALASGSVIIYFLQPVVAKVALAGVFLFSIRRGVPMIARLTQDLIALPAELVESGFVRTFFAHATGLWAFTLIVHAGLSSLALFTQSPETYVVVKDTLNVLFKAGPIVGLFIWFKVLLRRNGVQVKFS